MIIISSLAHVYFMILPIVYYYILCFIQTRYIEKPPLYGGELSARQVPPAAGEIRLLAGPWRPHGGCAAGGEAEARRVEMFGSAGLCPLLGLVFFEAWPMAMERGRGGRGGF